MLQSIRDKAQGWIAYVIVFLISIPFALWGIHEYTGGGSEPAVAKVGDQEITERALLNRVNILRNSLLEQFNGRIPPLFTEEILREQALNTIVDNELLVQKAADLNVSAGDVMVMDEIRNVEAFQVGGVFDQEAYKRAVNISGMSTRAFEEQTRAGLATRLIRTAISESEPITDAEIDALLKLKNQKRTVSWLTVNAVKITDVPEVTDADIENYYNENKEMFPKPEQVRLEYIELTLDTIAAGVTIDEETIRAYYDDPEKQKQFISEESRDIRHILIKVDENRSDEEARQEAQRILDELRAGGDFAELAKQYSEDQGSGSRGGELGPVKRGVMVKPFEDAAFALEKDQLSDLVRTRFGYHIIEVTDIEGGELQPFDEVRQQIADELKREEARERFADKYDELGNLSYATPDSLEPAAEALGIPAQQSDWVPKTGGTGPLSNAAIISTVFSQDALENRLNSEIIELSVDDYIVVRVIDYEPETIRPLEEVRDQIRVTLEAENRKNLVEEKARSLLAEIETGKSLDEVAAEGDYSFENEKEIGREEADLATQIRDKAFSMAPAEGGAPVWDIAELPNGSYALVGLHSVTDGDAATVSQQERDSLRQRISGQRGREMLASYIDELRGEIGVRIIEN
ncbi:MAG: SurA N-terminal domain-containing protein [Gammaproteobacteria bacterium]|jgi:peptidyl-prolyl cis-trans isomerase D